MSGPDPKTSDCLVIGSGLSGLAAGIGLRSRGRSVTILSRGPGASAVSSGVWSFGNENEIGSFDESFSKVPLRKILSDGAGRLTAKGTRECAESIAAVLSPDLEIHWSWSSPFYLPTSLGEWRPAFGAQAIQGRAKRTGLVGKRVGLVSSKKWRWLSSEALVRFQRSAPEIAWEAISLDFPERGSDWPLPRIAALLENDDGARSRFFALLEGRAAEMKTEFILFPPILLGRALVEAGERLRLPIGECVATLEPTPGYRLHLAIEKACARLGISRIEVSKASFTVSQDTVTNVRAQTPEGTIDFIPPTVVLSTGKIFAGGIRLGHPEIDESLLHLPLFIDRTRGPISLRSQLDWTERGYGSEQDWARLGVWTDGDWIPRDQQGRNPVKNIRASGSVLGGVDWAREGVGLGMAAITGRASGENG